MKIYKCWLYSYFLGKHVEFETTNPNAFDENTLGVEGS